MAALTRAVTTFLAAILLAACAAAQAQDARRIVAVGDLHGDYEAWRAIARRSGVADDRGRWIGGTTVLVQLGDVADRGPDSRKIYADIRRLEREAGRAGGEVVMLVGNHEAMNVSGDLRYVDPGEYAAFAGRGSSTLRARVYEANREAIEAFYAAQDPPIDAAGARDRWMAEHPLGYVEHRRAWRPNGELGSWIVEHPAVALIDGVLFVHGGISAEFADRPSEAINAEVRAALERGESDEPSILDDPLGPLWYRGNVQRDDEDVARPSIADELDTVLAAYGAERLVVAHTPSIEGIVASEGGRLIRADTGISSYYGGPASYLEFRPDGAVAHQRAADGSWSARPLPLEPREAGE